MLDMTSLLSLSPMQDVPSGSVSVKGTGSGTGLRSARPRRLSMLSKLSCDDDVASDVMTGSTSLSAEKNTKIYC